MVGDVIPLECPLHVMYEALEAPSTDCKTCWYIYRALPQWRFNGVVVKRK